MDDQDYYPTAKLRPSSPGTFPSRTHREALHHALIETRYSNLAEQERWYLHAYRYGFRRVALGDRASTYEADPSGKWFDEHLVELAEKYYHESLGR